MRPTVADHLVAELARSGVRRIYGVGGDSLNPVVDAVRRNRAIDWVLVRHEEAGAFAAGAEAQLTGELVACAASSGPGNLHLINGLFDAHRSGAPVLAIAAHIPSSEIGSHSFQETHPTQLFQECSHFCELVSSAEQAVRVSRAATRTAIAEQGVAVVVLPGDVAAQPLLLCDESRTSERRRPAVRPAEEELGRLADILNGAGAVTLFCGAGCRGAHTEVLALAGALEAPVGHSLRGKEWVAHGNPFDVGMTGLLGYGAAHEAMHDCDVLVLLGTDLPHESFYPRGPAIVQVDRRVERLGRRTDLELGLAGDVGTTIRELLPRLRPRRDRAHLARSLDVHHRRVRRLRRYVAHVAPRTPIHPEYVTAVLDEVAADDAVFTVDTGMNTVWAARHLSAAPGRRLLGSFTHGSMANALPQAIGAQLAYPGRQVIALSGDGGFAMLMGDVLTLGQHDLPVKLVVYDNGALGMVKLEMQVAGLPDWRTDLKNPDFAALARSVGLLGIRAEEPGDVRPALEQALAHDGPALVDVVTDPRALSIPPRITAEYIEGFGVGTLKKSLAGHVGHVVSEIERNGRPVFAEIERNGGPVPL
jgi:pyruvate dehydrogenase (quinone)